MSSVLERKEVKVIAGFLYGVALFGLIFFVSNKVETDTQYVEHLYLIFHNLTGLDYKGFAKMAFVFPLVLLIFIILGNVFFKLKKRALGVLFLLMPLILGVLVLFCDIWLNI